MRKRVENLKISSLKMSIVYFVYLLVVWTFYRTFFKFSDSFEELVVKPVVWLLPLVFIIHRYSIPLVELGITRKNFLKSVYLSLALGVGLAFLGLIANIAKYGAVNFEANIGTEPLVISILVSFATSITEELVFRGYLLGVLTKRIGVVIGIIFNSMLWTLIHAPISIFVWRMDGVQVAVYLFLTFVYGLGSSLLYKGTKNIAAPIFLHVLWEWPIILFR